MMNSLNDNALGSSNVNVQVLADRFKIDLTLTKKTLTSERRKLCRVIKII